MLYCALNAQLLLQPQQTSQMNIYLIQPEFKQITDRTRLRPLTPGYTVQCPYQIVYQCQIESIAFPVAL
jgi:hypothetical protein